MGRLLEKMDSCLTDCDCASETDLVEISAAMLEMAEYLDIDLDMTLREFIAAARRKVEGD
jgi:hypothetical protein